MYSSLSSNTGDMPNPATLRYYFSDPLLVAYQINSKSLSEIRSLVFSMLGTSYDNIIFKGMAVSYPYLLCYYIAFNISQYPNNPANMVVGSRIKELLKTLETQLDLLTKAATEATQRAKYATALKKDSETQHKYSIGKANLCFPGKRGRKTSTAIQGGRVREHALKKKQQMFASGDDNEELALPKKEKYDDIDFGDGAQGESSMQGQKRKMPATTDEQLSLPHKEGVLGGGAG